MQVFIQHFYLDVNSIRRRNCWGSSVWISVTDQIFCINRILENKWECNGEYVTYLSISRRPV